MVTFTNMDVLPEFQLLIHSLSGTVLRDGIDDFFHDIFPDGLLSLSHANFALYLHMQRRPVFQYFELLSSFYFVRSNDMTEYLHPTTLAAPLLSF